MKTFLVLALLHMGLLTASPTSVFWTDCTTICQPENTSMINLTTFCKRDSYDASFYGK